MISEIIFHPGLVLIFGALILPFVYGNARNAIVLVVPLIALLLLWQLPNGTVWQTSWLGYNIEPLVVDRLSRLFATIFILMSFGGGLYALRQGNRMELPAAFIYAGSAVGVTLAGDLITVFVFWELMAVGSTLVIWSAGTRSAYAASLRYIMIHLLGGVVLFAGIAGYLAETGNATFGRFANDTVSQWLILVGFLINAGAAPLSAWLPDAYPEASWSGTVFLSAFTTKTAVYVLLRGFPGTELLIWVGLFMVFYGIVYALLENDMRRILAYSIINQVGFMIAGIGIGTELALNGAAAHAFTHILYKALLLMSAGAVLRATGRRKCSELGGLFHSMPITTICGCIGALAISSFPLTSGFISKPMITQAAVDGHLFMVWLLLGAASAGVFLHAGIKFPWFVFFQKDSGLRPKDPPASMRWAMILFAFLCIALGVWPEALYRMLPYPVQYESYTVAHVLTQLQLLLFSGLAFFLMLGFLKRTPTITLDFDWCWRILLPVLARRIGQYLSAIQAYLNKVLVGISKRLEAGIARQRRPQGFLVRTLPTSSVTLWVMVMLLGHLVLYYLS
jgi:multicomponent Na+:H+ antiporter subunit D